MNKQLKKNNHHSARHRRVRAKIYGTKERPRVAVFKSNRNLFVQFIDDEQGKTLLSSNSIKSKNNSDKLNKTLEAGLIGELLGKKAVEAGIKSIVFDKGGNKYHGRVKSVAEALRASGIKF